jgi:V/A-type H+-transporting ATPase subunit K
MYWLVGLMSLSIFGLVLSGILLEIRPGSAPRVRPWYKPALGIQLLAFLGAQLGLLVLGISDAMAETEDVVLNVTEISTGMGLAILGAGIPTAVATIGAGIAVGPIGAASLATIAEKPETLGRTLIYLGLAEGIAIYGLVISILLLNKI